MPDVDVIVIGAGHNGLTAAALLAREGRRVLVLEKNDYLGGMASTVELFEGYRYEVAGSVLLPTPEPILADLGLTDLPRVSSEVMSVNVADVGDEPMVFYRDPVKLAEHLDSRFGAEAVLGMFNAAIWCDAPARALGRWETRTEPKTLDEMYAVASTEDERRAITQMLFSSAAELMDTWLPDKDKHASLRAMLAFLAINSSYRGPADPGSAVCLAFALAPPPGEGMIEKLVGGIGAIPARLAEMVREHGGEIRRKAVVEQVLTQDGRVTGVRLKDGSTVTAPVVVSNLDPGVTVGLLDPDVVPADLTTRVQGVDHRASWLQMHFALSDLPTWAEPMGFLNDDPSMQGNISFFGRAEDLQLGFEECRRGVVPESPSFGMQIPSVHDRTLAPEGHHAASIYAMNFPVSADRSQHGHLKNVMAEKVLAKLERLAPGFNDLVLRKTTFTGYHMDSMFAAPAGDFCHGLMHPDQMGAYRPGPRGWRDLPLPVEGLYLAGAGCYGGPGISFVPGYNAGYAVLEDLSSGSGSATVRG